MGDCSELARCLAADAPRRLACSAVQIPVQDQALAFIGKHWFGYVPAFIEQKGVYSIKLDVLDPDFPGVRRPPAGVEPRGESKESWWGALLDLHSRFPGSVPFPTSNPFKG